MYNGFIKHIISMTGKVWSIALRHNLASNYKSIIGKSLVSLYRLWQHDFGHNVDNLLNISNYILLC